MKVTCQISMRVKLFLALRSDVLLKRSQCCLVADDSVPDTENVSSSNWREFDGGIIAHAGGAGGFGCGWQWTLAFDEHPATIIKLVLKRIVLSLSISKFLCVFGIKCRYVSLPGLHVIDGGICQNELLFGFIALVFVGDGVTAVVVN